MTIPNPDIYFGKKLRVFCTDGIIIEGPFDGYNYDYDDEGNEFLEFDVTNEIGLHISLTEDEIERIEILGETK